MWIAGLSFFILFLILCGWRMEGEGPRTHGSAGWCRVWPLFKKGFMKRRGLLVGDWNGLVPIHYEQTHAITFGATGGGKGTTAVLPNLLSYPYVFLLDPGGENTAVAAKHWRESGYELGCINFFGMHGDAPWSLPAHGFNPLDLLDPGSLTFAADALVIADMLIGRSGKESEAGSFFKNTARGHLRDFIVHCKTAEPAERQNLATVFEYAHCDAGAWEELLAGMKANDACGGIARIGAIALERREAQAPEEFSAVLSTMQEHLNWMIDIQVRTFLSRSDVDFSILKGNRQDQRGGIVSVILPLQYNQTHAAISRLAMACAVLTMQRAPLAREKVLFVIDEAADLGRIERLPQWLATLRKYQVVLWPIFQNMGQLAELYGRGWQTLTANCGLLQILSIGNELETAEHTERLLGKCTIETVTTNGRGERSISQAARALLTADELRRLESDRQIVLIGNMRPIKLHQTPYWKRSELEGRFHPNPYYTGKSGRPSLTRALCGRLYYALIWIMAPHPVAAVIIALTAAYLAAPFVLAMIEGATRS